MSALDRQPEEWREIKGYPGYEISSVGRVGSWKPARNNAQPPSTRRILKERFCRDGYRRAALTHKGKEKTFRVCRLVAAAWHGEPRAGDVVRHLDGTRDNDTPENLKWGTPKENSRDSFAHGTARVGERVNTCKLKEADVIEILHSSAGPTELSKKYGVTPGQISHIRYGRSWNHVSTK